MRSTSISATLTSMIPNFVYDVYERLRQGGGLGCSDRFNQLPELRQRWMVIGRPSATDLRPYRPRLGALLLNAPKVHPGLTENRNFIFLDPPLQQQYRKLFNTFFSPRRIERAEAGA